MESARLSSIRVLLVDDICAELYIAPNTLRTHVQNLLAKLRIHSKLEAVALALRQQLEETPLARVARLI